MRDWLYRMFLRACSDSMLRAEANKVSALIIAAHGEGYVGNRRKLLARALMRQVRITGEWRRRRV